MPSIPNEEDVAAGVRSRMVALGNATFPGGIHFQRHPGGTRSFPYAVITVEASDPEDLESDGTYAQRFKAQVTAWVKSSDAAAASTSDVRTVLSGLGANTTDPTGGITVASAEAVLQVARKAGRLRVAPELRAGQDVLAAAIGLEIMVQGKE